MTREYLTLAETLSAMAFIAGRNIGTVITMHTYRTHTGDPFPDGGKAAWDGPLAHEVRVKLAVTEDYLDAAEVVRLVSDLNGLGFDAYFGAGGYEDGYLSVVVGRQGQRRVMSA